MKAQNDYNVEIDSFLAKMNAVNNLDASKSLQRACGGFKGSAGGLQGIDSSRLIRNGCEVKKYSRRSFKFS